MTDGPKHTIAGDRLPFITITGFMGTGKTETARVLAELLGLDFVDTDRLIEEMERTTVSEIFERRGERHFRRIEERVCRDLADRSGVVVATGGGSLINRRNLDVLSGLGKVVLLEASVDTIVERVRGNPSRPLLCGNNDRQVRERITEMLKEREPVYGSIESRVDTTQLSPVEVACRIAASLDFASRVIAIRTPSRGMARRAAAEPDREVEDSRDIITRIEIGRGLLSTLGERLSSAGLRSPVFLLIPRTIRDLFLPQISASLEAASIPWKDVPVRDGDAGKNLQQVGELIDCLASQGAERNSVAVAVGGGVVGDLAGFAASIYMRGMPLVHVPTTLLAQVDSSIGGKTGVNHSRAKNLIGSFYPPLLVLSDPCTLRTLPGKEISNGMAEVVKTAVLGSPELFNFLERELAGAPSRKLREIDFLEFCVAECASVKARVVDADPFEMGERRILNLGHTLGHALEAVEEYCGLAHGEAVAVGLVAATGIAVRRGLVEEDLLERIRDILRRCGLPVAAPAFDREEFLRSLHLDKKKRSGRLHFVLPVRLGSVDIVDDVTEAEILSAIGGK